MFRVEDTDAARDSEESYRDLLDALRWLGLDWDEGPEVGGPYGPYRQSERRDIYRDVIAKLVDGGHVYESFSNAEEIEARHVAAGRNAKLGYDNFDRELTDEQKAAFRRRRAASRCCGCGCPTRTSRWTDLVRGEVTFAAGSVPDFVVVRANGEPLYTLVNPVDDALMSITHVLRGEDLLPSTPRQIALYRALIDVGVADAVPQFGHLPYVMGEGNKKLSKRDPQSSLNLYREQGYMPEGLLNYLALLGWSIADDHDIFSMAEMVEAFDIADVNANPARFDPKKCEAINATHLRLLEPADFRRRLETYVLAAGLSRRLGRARRGRAARAGTGQDARRRPSTCCASCSSPSPTSPSTRPPRPSSSARPGRPCWPRPSRRSRRLPEWTHEAIEAALSAALVEGLGLKPRNAFGPLRVAVTGSTVSPPLFESMEILGRERSLARLAAART